MAKSSALVAAVAFRPSLARRQRNHGKADEHGGGHGPAATEAKTHAHEQHGKNVEGEKRQHGEIEPGLKSHGLRMT